MSMQQSIEAFADTQALAAACSDAVARLLIQAVQDYGEASIALAGGSTPLRMYELLAEQHRDAVPWQSVHFFWSDERCVPPDDPASNYGAAQGALLSRIPAWQEKIHRLHGEAEPLAEAARYSARLCELFDDQLGDGEIVFDLVLLGIGTDGHTASLFPDDSAALAATEPCIAVNGVAGTPPIPRLTLTLPVINAARQIYVLASGAQKAPVLRAVLNGGADAAQYPVARVQPQNGGLHWWLDSAALGG